jgi:hypothetical protein
VALRDVGVAVSDNIQTAISAIERERGSLITKIAIPYAFRELCVGDGWEVVVVDWGWGVVVVC